MSRGSAIDRLGLVIRKARSAQPPSRRLTSHTESRLDTPLSLSVELSLYALLFSFVCFSVRGQSVLKLYVLFNMLQVSDRLLSSFGESSQEACMQAVTDLCRRRDEEAEANDHHRPQNESSTFASVAHSRLSTPTLSSADWRSGLLQFLGHLFVFSLYLLLHCALLFCTVITLNVSVNSDASLFILVISTNFIEIKQCAFKKYDSSQLLTITYGDACERFSILLHMAVILLRNASYISLQSTVESLPSGLNAAINPFEWTKFFFEFAWQEAIWSLILPSSDASSWLAGTSGMCILVLAGELLVDYVKHGFICKYNALAPRICYRQYFIILCCDVAVKHKRGQDGDMRDAARRIGIATMPAAVLLICVVASSLTAAKLSLRARLASLAILWIAAICAKTLLASFLRDFGSARQTRYRATRRLQMALVPSIAETTHSKALAGKTRSESKDRNNSHSGLSSAIAIATPDITRLPMSSCYTRVPTLQPHKA